MVNVLSGVLGLVMFGLGCASFALSIHYTRKSFRLTRERFESIAAAKRGDPRFCPDCGGMFIPMTGPSLLSDTPKVTQ